MGSQAVVVGQYRLRFPVSVPEQIPVYNVWLLTFCESVEGASCTEPSGANSLLTFPIVGFNHGDVSPDFSVSGATARGGFFFNATLLVCVFFFFGSPASASTAEAVKRGLGNVGHPCTFFFKEVC